MSQRIQFVYREFYDVPRMLVLNHGGLKLLLVSPFDESMDEYAPTYKVYVLPNCIDEQKLVSWENLHESATECLGQIRVEDVAFDPTRRSDIDIRAIEAVLNSNPG